MKVELPVKGKGAEGISLLLEDAKEKGFYEVSVILKKQHGGFLLLGKIDKKELKRLGKAS